MAGHAVGKVKSGKITGTVVPRTKNIDSNRKGADAVSSNFQSGSLHDLSVAESCELSASSDNVPKSSPGSGAQKEIDVVLGENIKSSNVPQNSGEASIQKIVEAEDDLGLFGECPNTSTKKVTEIVEPIINADTIKIHAKQSFADILQKNKQLREDNKLEKIISDGLLCLREEDTVKTWHASIIGYFTGKWPGVEAVKGIVKSWGVHCDFHLHSSGWIIFKFDNRDDMRTVLHGGPYSIWGRSLLMKELPKEFSFTDEEIAQVPVWVQLPNLPLEFWSPKILSQLATLIGDPISMDTLTAKQHRVSYARIYVQVDASKELVRKIKFQTPTGRIVEQQVVYEFEPVYCERCRFFGHAADKCPGARQAQPSRKAGPRLQKEVTKVRRSDPQGSTAITDMGIPRIEVMKTNADTGESGHEEEPRLSAMKDVRGKETAPVLHLHNKDSSDAVSASTSDEEDNISELNLQGAGLIATDDQGPFIPVKSRHKKRITGESSGIKKLGQAGNRMGSGTVLKGTTRGLLPPKHR